MDYFDVLFAKTNGISEGTCYNETEAMLKTTVGHSSKNLMPITLESGTYNQGGANLTYTVDKVAGTITLNGTTRTTGTFTLDVFDDIDGKVSGKLYLSGAYNEGARLFCRDITEDDYPKQWDGETVSVSCKNDTENIQELLVSGHHNAVRIRCYAGYTFNNAVLKPMLRYGSISDSTFESYVTPTDEKKQDKPVVLWEATAISELSSSVIFHTSDIDYINYFIVYVRLNESSNEVVTHIVYNDVLLDDSNRYIAPSSYLVYRHIYEDTVFTAQSDSYNPKIIKIIGIPK